MSLPKNSFHPGEMLLEEVLVPGKMTQAVLAQKLGWTRTRLNELIKGTRDITADFALGLALALGTSAKLWMNLQAMFDLDKAMRRRKIA
ncbi:MAG: HigA family addiction module antitoxin [Nitrospira sp.]